MFGALLIIGKIVAASGNKAEQKAEVKTKAKTKDKTVRNTRKVFFMCAAVNRAKQILFTESANGQLSQLVL